MEPVRLAMVGLGGYGGWMLDVFCREADRDNPPIRFEAACEPNLPLHQAKVDRLKARGVKIFSDYDQLLAQPGVEAVYLPLPIGLHRPFTEKAVAAGKAVIVEKPVTGSIDDLRAMIDARDKHGGHVAVGFQDIYSDTTLRLKQELLGGAIGAIRGATVHACIPRGESYYLRNDWAGKIKHNGSWVLDSPANNAVSHSINLALFFLGKSLPAMAKLESVSAELYRVYDIENYDTCSLRVMTQGQVPLLVHFTHACREQVLPHIQITGDRGTMKYVSIEQAVLEAGGKRQVIKLTGDARGQMIERFAKWVRGDQSVFPVSLEMAGAHLTVINGASEAAKVRTVKDFDHRPADEEDAFRVLPGIEGIFERCSAEQKMIHELGGVAWSVPARTVKVADYNHFADVPG